MPFENKIGILMGTVYKKLNQSLLEGMIYQLQAAGYSAFIFTLNDECHNERIMHGETNLLQMMDFSAFAGVIFVPHTFSSMEYVDHIAEYLHQHCAVPVIRISADGQENDIWYDDAAEFAETVKHLSTAHGCRRILCMTGTQGHPASERRLQGYLDAMQSAGLSVSENDIFYGDFWIESAKILAQELADGSRPLPDAVVCANDNMALSLCDALREKGISVPEQLRITGFDGIPETRLHVPPLTTYQTSQRQLGIDAARRLLMQITGKNVLSDVRENGTLIFRESCGCDSGRENIKETEYDYHAMEVNYLDYGLSATLHDADSLAQFIRNMLSMQYVYFESPASPQERFYLCLSSDWDKSQSVNGRQIFRKDGYADKTELYSWGCDGIVFDTADMLPRLAMPDRPTVTLFTAVHFLDRCFGYACLQTDGSIQAFNRDYIRYCREINNGLEFLCTQNELKRSFYRRHLAQSRDALTGTYLLENSTQILQESIEAARLNKEALYAITLTVGGLDYVEHEAGSAERERYLVMTADILSAACHRNEHLFRFGNCGFVILGAQLPPVSRPARFLNSAENQLRKQHFVPGDSYIVYLVSRIHMLSDSISADTLLSELCLSVNELETGVMQMRAGLQPYFLIMALRQEIWLHPEQDWNSTECSSRLHISKSYFHKIYKQIFGITFIQDVRYSRVSLAKMLLRTTGKSLTEIAEKCGAEYVSFMRLFKQETGITPTEYRNGNTAS